jgi:hypothetical protein
VAVEAPAAASEVAPAGRTVAGLGCNIADRSAIVCTDRRLFVAERGELVSDADRRPQSWRHQEVPEVRFETGRIAGTVTLETAERAARAPVLTFDERDTDEVRLAVDRLREVLGDSGEAAPEPDVRPAQEAQAGEFQRTAPVGAEPGAQIDGERERAPAADGEPEPAGGSAS